MNVKSDCMFLFRIDDVPNVFPAQFGRDTVTGGVTFHDVFLGIPTHDVSPCVYGKV